jgi:hypothetical protein
MYVCSGYELSSAISNRLKGMTLETCKLVPQITVHLSARVVKSVILISISKMQSLHRSGSRHSDVHQLLVVFFVVLIYNRVVRPALRLVYRDCARLTQWELLALTCPDTTLKLYVCSSLAYRDPALFKMWMGSHVRVALGSYQPVCLWSVER